MGVDNRPIVSNILALIAMIFRIALLCMVLGVDVK